MADTEETQICSNCKKPIGVSKFDLHEIYCMRNIIKCPKCSEMVDKNQMEDHEKEAHQLKQCEYCGIQFEVSKLTAHADKCTSKPKKCPYCDVKIQTTMYDEHMYQCGGRTKVCDICRKSISVREYEVHVDSCVGNFQDYPPLPKPNPEPTKNLAQAKLTNTKPAAAVPVEEKKVPEKPKQQPVTSSTNSFNVPAARPVDVQAKPTIATDVKVSSTNTSITTTVVNKNGGLKPGGGPANYSVRANTTTQNIQPPPKPAPKVEEKKPIKVEEARRKEPSKPPVEAPIDDSDLVRRLQEEFDMQLARELNGEKGPNTSARDEAMARRLQEEMNAPPAPAPAPAQTRPRLNPEPASSSNFPAPGRASQAETRTQPQPQPAPARYVAPPAPAPAPYPAPFGGGFDAGQGFPPDNFGDFEGRPMTASYMDEDLQKAIQASLQASRPVPPPPGAKPGGKKPSVR